MLPSILESKIPTTLLKPCRQVKENRLTNSKFITAIRRSHRIKIFNEHQTLTCKCGKNIDKFGDHIFSCTHHSKTKMHNHLRNTIHYITQNIGTYANFIQDKESCKLEEAELLPAIPTLRPGDITIHPYKVNNSHLTNYNEKVVIIDCTINGNISTQMKTPTTLQEAYNNQEKQKNEE